MKFVIVAMILWASNSAMAEKRYLACSNAVGSIQRDESKITIKAITLAGPETIQLKNEVATVTSSQRTILKTETTQTDTICNVPLKVKETSFVEEITFTKNDKTAIVTDDTPRSSPASMTEIILCNERIVDDWPCK